MTTPTLSVEQRDVDPRIGGQKSRAIQKQKVMLVAYPPQELIEKDFVLPEKQLYSVFRVGEALAKMTNTLEKKRVYEKHIINATEKLLEELRQTLTEASDLAVEFGVDETEVEYTNPIIYTMSVSSSKGSSLLEAIKIIDQICQVGDKLLINSVINEKKHSTYVLSSKYAYKKAIATISKTHASYSSHYKKLLPKKGSSDNVEKNKIFDTDHLNKKASVIRTKSMDDLE